MNASWSAVVGWLVDYQLLALGLLAGALLAAAALRQPARRLALLRATLGALAALALLCATPGWSLVHLESELPDAARVLIEPSRPVIDSYPPPENNGSQTSPDNVPPLVGRPAPLAAEAAVIAPTEKQDPIPPLPAMLLTALYLCGSAVVAAWLLLGAWRTRRIVERAAAASPELAEALAAIAAPQPAPRLLVSDEIAVAAAVGVRRPTILLPSAQPQARDERSSAAPAALKGPDLAAILAHEWAHVRGGDLRTIAVARWLLVLMWPQPLYWLLRRIVRLDQESLADVAAAELTSRSDYAERLVAWARRAATLGAGSRLSAAAGLWEGPSQLKRRVKLLLDERFTVLRECSQRWRRTCLVAALAVAGTLSLVTLQPQSQATPPTASAESEAKEKSESNSPQTSDVAEALDLREYLRTAKRTPNAVAGMCIDEEGRPVSGATVVLSQYEMGLFAGGDPAQTKKLAEQTTGSDGRYRFDAAIDVAAVFPEGVPPMHFQRPPQRAVCVTAQATGRATAWQNDFASEVARNGRLDVLRLLPAGRLTGRILDEAGRPVVGATVATSGEGSYIPNMPGISLFSAVTDAEGRYEIGDIPAYVEADARKKHEAWAEQMRKDEAKSGTTTTFAVATSAVNPSDPYGFVPKPLLVRHGEFARYQGVVPSIPGEVDATLVAGAVIEGRAVTREGDAARPAVGVRVYVERSPDPAPKVTAAGNNFKLYELEQVVTDAEGRYRIGGLGGGGAYRVSGDMGSEWVAVGIAGLSTEAGKTTAAPDLVFTHGGVVRVNLVDAQTKQPLALPGGAKGFLNVAPAPGSPWRGTAFSTGYADFPEKGYLERHALPGKVLVFATILADDGSERYTSFDAAKSRSVEDMPTYDVVEGETLDVALPMRRSERNQTHKARLVPSSAEPATPAKDSSGRSDVTPFQRSNSRAKAQIVSLGTNPATASGSRRTRAGGWELVVGNATKPNPLAGEGTRAGVVDGALVQEPLGEFR